ncbi:MAG TPA: hypothetical protein VFK03_01950 [Candidatus Saccharimonadales bacterium]|nr:hypothetical protein [Candidatus Saccharimonadales bacterium]
MAAITPLKFDLRRRQAVFFGLVAWLVVANGAQLLARSVDAKLTHPPTAQAVYVAKPSQLPLGGRVLAGQYRLVALYGVTTSPSLGALGEQGLSASVRRIDKIAKKYQAYSQQKIMPTFELIASVASASPTRDHDYSKEASISSLRSIISYAVKHHIYVVLDLQPGRDDFLTQAKHYRELLAYPNVGLALDPEWRLKPHQLHLRQIGSVSAGEVNRTAAWLAQLVKTKQLPQKVFLLHQFRTSMIGRRTQLETHKELMTIIQMDGQGSQGAKLGSWRAVRVGAPTGIYFGWKNFYDEDQPTLSPKRTMALKPQPWYVSYQ